MSCLRQDVERAIQVWTTGIVLVVFFALKGSVVIWISWIIKDIGVRQAYHTSVNTAAADVAEH